MQMILLPNLKLDLEKGMAGSARRFADYGFLIAVAVNFAVSFVPTPSYSSVKTADNLFHGV